MKHSRLWALLLLVIAVLSLLSLLLIKYFQKQGDVVEIRQGGELLYTLPLWEEQTLTISNPNGGYNTVVIEQGTVSVTEANCPDGVCVNHGPTSQTADPIVCLPNRLVVQVITQTPDELDGVSG